MKATFGAALLGSLLIANAANATTYSLYIHGRTGGVTGCGVTQPTPSGWSYWGVTGTGINPIPVNYDGTAHISVANPTVRAALDTYCTGSNACYVACHSAGCAHLGYALDHFGGGNRWNIIWADAAGSAEGGTELADYFSWASCDPLGSDIRTGTVRGMYNHNNLQGNLAFMFAGAKGTAYSFALPGDDDQVVPFHSSGGMSSTGRWCVSGTFACTTLPGGTSGKYSSHTLFFRDDAESFDHYSPNGIPHVMFGDMTANAF